MIAVEGGIEFRFDKAENAAGCWAIFRKGMRLWLARARDAAPSRDLLAASGAWLMGMLAHRAAAIEMFLQGGDDGRAILMAELFGGDERQREQIAQRAASQEILALLSEIADDGSGLEPQLERMIAFGGMIALIQNAMLGRRRVIAGFDGKVRDAEEAPPARA